MKKAVSIILTVVLCLSTVVFASAQTVDLNSLSFDELVTLAKQDGHVESVGMPGDWANWEASWNYITNTYGITHYDTDMTSAEELAVMKAEGANGTKDIGDVGHAFTTTVVDEGITQGYKPSTWDSIPDWAKDPEGRWIISYTGTISFATNTTLTNGVVPTSWADLMDSKLNVSVGNVVAGASSQAAVLSCAIAMGGGLDNVQPGIDYFKKLAEEGRLDPGDTNRERLANGEIVVCAGLYDYSSLAHRDAINASDSGMKIEVTIPQDGAVTSGYALVFNANAPHPYATALTMEYMLSDQGQIDRAYGYARPVRDVQLPADAQAMMLDASLYANTTPITDVTQFSAACKQIATLWEEEVVPSMY